MGSAADEYAPLLPETVLSTTQFITPRIILGVDALEKSGKTNFGFTAPKPILYMDLDIGREGVVDKFKHPLIVVTRPFMFRATKSLFDPANGKKSESDIIMEKAEPELERFRRTYLSALDTPIVKSRAGKSLMAKTIVIDTGTETWELLRLCKFGKLSQVKSHHYTEVNGMMRDLVRAGFDSPVNVIWLHKLKGEWKEGAEGKQRKTGALERQGFQDMGFLVQANVLLYRAPLKGARPRDWKWKSGEGQMDFVSPPREDDDDLGFRLMFGDSRHNPALAGIELQSDMVNFKTVASMMLPEADPAAWEDAR